MTKIVSRKKLKLGEQDFVLLFFGTIRENKGLDILLDAFEMVALRDDRFVITSYSIHYTKLYDSR